MSELSDHKRYKKHLIPPLMQIPDLTFTSWINERLPEMIWVILIDTGIERKRAFSLFRSLGDYIHNNPECSDITISGISIFPRERRDEFIKNIISFSNDAKFALRPLMLFPDLPIREEWGKYLGKPDEENDWQRLGIAVSKTLNRHSDESIDCRLAMIMGYIASGKLIFPDNLKNRNNIIDGLCKYPDCENIDEIKAFISSSEGGIWSLRKMNKYNWAKEFWQYCYDNTLCIPESELKEDIDKIRDNMTDYLTKMNNKYYEEASIAKNRIIEHYFKTSSTSGIDSKHEGAFGITLYGLNIFSEIIIYKIPLSIISRLVLRALTEAYITLRYLLEMEKTEPRIWDEYRSYGTGQLKLICLKLKESGKDINSIDIAKLDYLINEDKSSEFVPIDLGHWGSSDLRSMSEKIGLKDVYDKYYNYTSGYVHANWGAIRESTYQICMNPLHRFHRIPKNRLVFLPSVINDAVNIMNHIINCLSEAYPEIEFQFSQLESKNNNGQVNESK